MSATILSGDFTVYFTNDSSGDGDLQITWTGSAAGTRTVNEVYSALQDLFDNNTAGVGDYMDEGIPMSASTPTQYTIGEVETNDNEPWFIDSTSIQHLTGGALDTTGWTRSLPGDGTGNIGIVKVFCDPNTIVTGDVGNAITHTDGDDGILLAVESDGLIIRPDTNALADDFNSTSGTLSCNGHTSGTQSVAAATGERVWSNPFTIGNVFANTRIYVYQGFSEITNFWGEGHIDRLFLTFDGFDADLIDYGNLTFFARQYSTLYDFSIATFDDGGRAPVALSTSGDTNNTTGYWTMSISSATGAYVDSELITGDFSGASGVITSATGSPTTSIEYYLVADKTVNFQNGDTITGATSGVNDGVAGTPAATTDGPTDLPSAVTINFGADLQDIGDGDLDQPYDVVINLGGNTLSDFYEYTKYITSRGYTSDLDPNADQEVIGESYLGVGDIFVPYDTASNDPPFNEGEVVENLSTDFYGIITSVHDTGTNVGFLTIRDTRGTALANDDVLTGDVSGHTVLVNTVTDAIENITQLRATPFGSFAGGQFFGARGVWIENMHANDANSYTLIDSNGVTRTPPATYPISITANDASNNPVEGAQVFVRKSGSYYDYTSHNTNNSAGDATFEVNETVDTDLPQSGWLHVWDSSSNTKQNYRFQSWSGLSFALNTEVTGSATSTGSSTSLISTSTNFLTADIEEGDAIRNTIDVSWAVVDEIVDADNITTSPLQGGSDNTWTSGDTFSVHRLALTYDNTDTADVPIFNGQTNASGIASTTYAGSVPINIVVRIRSNEGATKYIPFNTSGTLSSSGFSLTAVLTEDTVAT
jgi:hypothetical protein